MSKAAEFDLVLEAGRADTHYWRDLWRYRELFYFLSWRDILVRYKQTAIGIAWSVIRPLLTMIVFTVIFGKLARLPDEGVPYPVLVFAAMLPWQFFSTALGDASASLVGNANLLTKVYFPRMIIPVSSVLTNVVDLAISFGLMLLLMLIYGIGISWQILTLPLFVFQALAAALAGGLFLCALNVRYRDFRYIVPFLIQLGLYISPVGFSSSVVPPEWRLVYSLNPMVAVIDGFRWALLGQTSFYVPGFVLGSVVTFGLLVYGVAAFRRMERRFADII